MTAPLAPPSGSMYIFDDIAPALDAGDYQIVAATEVEFDGQTHVRPLVRSLRVEGPRFNLPPDEVLSVYPPRNARGDFQLGLPQIVLRRRTLPWERPLDAHAPIPPPKVVAGDPPPVAAPAPWLALLVLEDEDDYQVLKNVPLERVVPADVLARLGSPTSILCDAIDIDRTRLGQLLPSKEELKLLAHARQVNVDDRELAVGTTDGFYSVVISNRLPAPGATCRVCLVSLEERSDLVAADPPPEATQVVQPPDRESDETDEVGVRGAVHAKDVRFVTGLLDAELAQNRRARLVLLHTWQFTCLGGGSFRELMQNLDVSMFGTPAAAGAPDVTDSGHVLVPLADRAGATEQVLYRGPLVGALQSRDTLGPYHSADQARRVSPETGLEDISYAAAFEVGRLLAASDRGLAQALMQWRRGSYRRSALLDGVAGLRARFTMPLPATALAALPDAVTPVSASGALARFVGGAGPVADPTGLGALAGVTGLDPTAVAAAWRLASPAQASAILGGQAGALGAVVAAVPAPADVAVTIDQVAADGAGLDRLTQSRNQTLANAATRLTSKGR